MEEKLLQYKDDFNKECKIIDFFVKTLNEIKIQIDFYGYLCEKDFKIFTQIAEKNLKKIHVLKTNLSVYKDEPSNLYLVGSEIIKVIQIYFSTYKKLYPDCLKSIKANINPITRNLENTKNNILDHSISMLEQALENGDKSELKKYLKETLELVMINTFKGLFNLYQLILIYSKKKNNLYQTIKTAIEEKTSSEEMEIVINDISEREYAQKYKVNYEPIHFGNNVYKSLLTDYPKDVLTLANSFLCYTSCFIKCIQMRKKMIKELRIFSEVLKKKNENFIPMIRKICEKITKITKTLTHSSPGTINSWNLVFSTWNTIYSSYLSYEQYNEEMCSIKLTRHFEECHEEYKKFEKKWEDYAEKIKELRSKYMKYNQPKSKKEESKEKSEEENNEKKKREDNLRNYLMGECSDFLDDKVATLRNSEIKRVNEVRDLLEKFKDNIKKNNDLYLEDTKNEYDNAASIDLFEQIQNIFEDQLYSLDINDTESYMDYLKEKISKINFNDNLAENARISLAEYYEYNDIDDGFDFSGDEMENPFGANVKDKEDISNNGFNFDEKKIIDTEIDLKDEISSIPNKINNENSLNNINELNNEIQNKLGLKTPNFGTINNENNKKDLNDVDKENLNKNLNSEFNELPKQETNILNFNEKQEEYMIPKVQRRVSHHDSKRRIDNLAGSTLCCLRGGNIDINNEIDNVNVDPNDIVDNKPEVNEISTNNTPLIKKEENLNNPNENKNTEKLDTNINTKEISFNAQKVANKKNEIDKTFTFNNAKNTPSNNKIDDKINNDQNSINLKKVDNNANNINIKNIRNQDKQTLHYGILGILGLFCLKSLFSTNHIFSADSFLNVVILGLISFIFYKTQFK